MSIILSAVILVLTAQSPHQGAPMAIAIDMSPAALQVYQEELLNALSHTPGATSANRDRFKREAEDLVRALVLKGQKIYHLKRRKVKVVWDLIDPFAVAWSFSSREELVVHLDEIMFFYYHDQHIRSVIPHEVSHLIYYQQWGGRNTSAAHDAPFDWIVIRLAPDYKHEDLDTGPGCRLLIRMLQANGVVGSVSDCGWFPIGLKR